MKRTLPIVVLVATVSSIALGQTGDKKSTGSAEQTVMQLEHDWYDASLKNDAAALDKILADDWVGQGPPGATTKTQAMADIKAGNSKMESGTLGDLKVRVFGDTAIVAGSDVNKSSYKGKDTSGAWNWTDVFVKRQGRWQAVASQLTPVASQ